MITVMKLLTAALAVLALFLLAPRLSYADSDQNCYNHPSDHSDFCYCYRHPKQCNAKYRQHHPDWNHHPNWYHEGHNEHPNGYNGEHYQGPPPNGYNGEHYHGPPPNQGNTYQQQYH
jgi:hypothetical protein